MSVYQGTGQASVDEACEMARAAIIQCGGWHYVGYRTGCAGCSQFQTARCALRLYLAKHGDQQAWEVNT